VFFGHWVKERRGKERERERGHLCFLVCTAIQACQKRNTKTSKAITPINHLKSINNNFRMAYHPHINSL